MTPYERMFHDALRVRLVEERIIELYPSDKIQSPVHLSIGQEHHIVALCAALEKNDPIYGTYRSHAPYLAKGGDMKRMFSELYGKAGGNGRGKAGSMHLCDGDLSLMASSAVVASPFPHAVGAAYAAKLGKKNQIVVSISGDGSTEEGTFAECLNFVSLKKLPVLFFIENNGLSIHTPIKARQSYELGKVCAAYGVEYWKAEDGFDMEKVREKVASTRKRMVAGSGSAVFEVMTCRYKVHVGVAEDGDLDYHDKDSDEKWRRRDPLILERELVTRFQPRIMKEIDDAVAFAEKDVFPGASELMKDIY
jgi:TPP-dependent pyruvate/acetoin dehydrogenase alpha subunit